MRNETPDIEEMTWDKAEKYARLIPKELKEIINAIDPGKDFKLIKVRYPFGAIILHDDVLYLPTGSITTQPITSNLIDERWKKHLSYRSIPLGMITKNSVEIYREIDEKVFSVALSGPNTGIELGVVETFGSTAAYTVSSGARSLYMLPKISKTSAHKKLRREFGLMAPPPKRLLDHWHIFRELSASPLFNSPWDCEVLFFNYKWDEALKNHKSLEWLRLKSYLQDKGWQHSELGRRKVILDVVWQQTSGLLTKMGIKPDPYVVDTLRHLIFVALGGISGSRPSNGDDFAGPLTKIQKIYTEVYGLTDQIPTIIRPYNFSLAKNNPVYYSMQTPMLLSSTPNFRSMSSNIEDIRDLINLKNLFFAQNYGNLKIDSTKFNEYLRLIKFEYFHAEMYAYGSDIRPTKEMPDKDQEWLYTPTPHKNQEFADNGTYIRGCVKISRN